MKRTIRAGITGALLLGAVAGLAAMGTVRPTSTPVPPAANDFTVNQDLGKLEIVTDAGGYLEIRYTGSLGNESHVISPKKNEKCKVLHLDKAAALMKLEVVSYDQVVPFVTDPDTADVGTFETRAVSSEIGLVDNGFGSYNQLNCNQANGRLEPGQGFKISLGSKFTTAGAKVDYAEFDIEAKFGSRFEARTNAAAEMADPDPDPDPDPELTDYVLPLGAASDNNADAGSTDNNRPQVGNNDGVTADDDFTTIWLAPASADLRGEFALEGGGDFTEEPITTRLRTVFYLGSSKTYEYMLDCVDDNDDENPDPAGAVDRIEESQDDDSDWFPGAGTAVPDQARLFRYSGYEHNLGVYVDKDDYPVKKTECEPIGANLNANLPDSSGVFLEPSDAGAFFRVELKWIIPADKVDGADDPAFIREVDPDGPGGDFDSLPGRYCESFGPSGPPSESPSELSAYNPSNPGVANHVLVNPDDPTNPLLFEFVPWCVISDVRELTQIEVNAEGGGVVLVDVVIQTQVWDGIGDPYWN